MTPSIFSPLKGGFLALDNSDTWVLVAFILFIALLTYVGAFRFIGRALDSRATGIREQLEQARQLREEAQARLAAFERQQHEVARTADEIVTAARREAEAAATQAKLDIHASVERRLKAAEDQIALAEAEAVRSVRNGAVDAAVAAARKVLAESYEGDRGAAMLDDAIREVGARVN